METTITPRSLGQPGILSDVRAFSAILRREWTIFTRYPSWIIALFIWPLIFPMMYILTARALSGPDGSGMAARCSAGLGLSVPLGPRGAEHTARQLREILARADPILRFSAASLSPTTRLAMCWCCRASSMKH